jgi:hypothetical protein
MFLGMNSTIRVGLPGDDDERGRSGLWWATGWCRPRYVWDHRDQPQAHRWFLRRWLHAAGMVIAPGFFTPF